MADKSHLHAVGEDEPRRESLRQDANGDLPPFWRRFVPGPSFIVSLFVLILTVGGFMTLMWGNIDRKIEREIGQLEERTNDRLDRMERGIRDDMQGIREDFKYLNQTLINNLLLLNREVGAIKGQMGQEVSP